MRNKRVIHFLAASDRNNYGDFLFPLIFKNVLKKRGSDYTVNYYGLVKSDFSFYGAIPTKSYKTLFRNLKEEGGILVVGGGDVFFANWETLFSYISPFFVLLYKIRLFRKLNAKLKILNFVFPKEQIMLPFTPGVIEFNSNKQINIVYNAVGGTFSNINKTESIEVVKRLNSSSFISVRDFRTKESLNKYHVKSVITPDSAVIMSDFYSKEYLNLKTTLDKSLLTTNYYFLQFGQNKGPENFEKAASELEKMAKKKNIFIILCPIGLALKHRDDLGLKKLAKLSAYFKFIMPRNIFDIMWLIANSKAYMGTSLHGALTAQSYEVPFISLNKKIKKADSYFKTWCPKISNGCIEFSELNLVDDIITNWDYKQAKDYLKEQIKLVYSNFDNILKNI